MPRSKTAQALNNARYHATEKGKASIARASEIRKAERAAFLAANPPAPPLGRAESNRLWVTKKYGDRPTYLLRKRYKLTHDELETLRSRNACAICERSTVNLVIDHHHETGQVRDRLCRRCNILVGMVEGPHLQKAIEYVARHSNLK